MAGGTGDSGAGPPSLTRYTLLMSKIPGVGYTPPPGQVFWIWPGSRESAGTTSFNPAAGEPFGTGPAGTLNLDVFNARYGGRPVREDGTIGNFVVDAETVLGLLTRAMEIAAEKGLEPEFKGKASTHTMVPTLRESHDYAATHPDGGMGLIHGVLGGSAGGGGNLPGQPKIKTIKSPAPGKIELSWITGAASSFLIKAGSFETPFLDQQQGNTRSAIIELPPGLGGEISVTIQAFRDGVGGKWSLAKRVTVEPRQSGPVEPPVEPKDIMQDSLAVTALELLKKRGYTVAQIAAAWEAVP